MVKLLRSIRERIGKADRVGFFPHAILETLALAPRFEEVGGRRLSRASVDYGDAPVGMNRQHLMAKGTRRQRLRDWRHRVLQTLARIWPMVRNVRCCLLRVQLAR
jgi:hypothetical protein